jgi:two-component system, NtrC family, response regulator AtoC
VCPRFGTLGSGNSLEKGQLETIPNPALRPVFLEGADPTIRAVESVIRELAQSSVPVLLLAEAGAGKRTIACRIHESSGGAGEFRVLRCADLLAKDLEPKNATVPVNGSPKDLFGSGTLYLKEIADLLSDSQLKLLEALPGITSRLICGSSRDLEEEVRSGRFREDLYYRISGVCLRLPPLRQRKEDIPSLTNFFLSKHAQDFCKPVPVLSPQTQQLFQDYSWPGNIRELEDAAKAIVVLGDESLAMGGLRAMLMKSERGGNGGRVSLKQAARAASRAAEKELILKVLTRTRWNRRRAAEELQISYKALLYKLKQIGYGECGTS